MRNRSLSGSIGSMLHRCKSLETSMRHAGVPAWLACLPLTMLAWEHCLILHRKTLRIARITKRIHRWLGTVQRLSAHEQARTEFIDLDRSMRDDIIGARDSMVSLRDLCLEICAGFSAIGHVSTLLERCRLRFVDVVAQACAVSDTLVATIDAHDRRALSVRQQLQAIEQAALDSASAQEVRATEV